MGRHAVTRVTCVVPPETVEYWRLAASYRLEIVEIFNRPAYVRRTLRSLRPGEA
jgi:hypothetical protein